MMVYLYQLIKTWMSSFEISSNRQVGTQKVVSVKEIKTKKALQDALTIDGDSLRNMIQILDNKMLELTTDLKNELKEVVKMVEKID